MSVISIDLNKRDSLRKGIRTLERFDMMKLEPASDELATKAAKAVHESMIELVHSERDNYMNTGALKQKIEMAYPEHLQLGKLRISILKDFVTDPLKEKEWGDTPHGQTPAPHDFTRGNDSAAAEAAEAAWESIREGTMIDFETEIFDGASRAAIAAFPGITVTSVPFAAPASFPSANITESGNVVDTEMTDSGKHERAAIVTYDVHAYSNLRKGAKAEARAVMKAIDGFMGEHNFTRTYMTQGAHPNNQSVYQVYCRYIASVGGDGKIYRRA